MTRRGRFKLLTQTSFIYLLFTSAIFLGFALILAQQTNEFIEGQIDHKFGKSEHRISQHLRKGKPPSEASPFYGSRLMTTTPEGVYPIYSDTTIYNAEQDEMQRFRKRVNVVEVDGKFYRTYILKGVDDFMRLKEDIFEALVPAFVALAVLFVLFNYLLSGYFFKPFNRILGLMQTYKVGQKSSIPKVATSAAEFQRMQDLFHDMINRIEHDYRNLKEYTENMAHEIQTPLSIIRSKTESIIADEAIMKTHTESIKAIYDETNHISKLGTTLNLLTKIENGEFNNTTEIRTRDVITSHVASVEELARLKSLTIETQLSDDHYILIDPLLFDIVLKNLLRNAIAHGTEAGPILLKTTTSAFSISNCGPPLEVDENKLFTRFGANNGKQGSLGLGLALVKKICELNDLTIDYCYHAGKHVFSIRRKLENGI